MTREEAIEVIKAKADYLESDKRFRAAVETIIPELAESEDERIRKELLAVINDLVLPNEQKARFNAWLEKQKESQELPLMNGDADLYFDTWRQEVPVPTFRQCFEEGMRYAQRLQKEHKPIDYDAELEKCKHNYLYFWDKYVTVKLKPAKWSEKDEKMIRCITERIESDIQYGDELTKAYGNQEISWLKSLRPSWKPSEEQMEQNYIRKDALLELLQGMIQSCKTKNGFPADTLAAMRIDTLETVISRIEEICKEERK